MRYLAKKMKINIKFVSKLSSLSPRTYFMMYKRSKKLPLVYFVKKIKTNKNRSTQMMNGINLFYSRASFTLFVCLTLYEGRIHAASISQKEFI